ncbi:hypothetical protein WR25_20357 isoform C [Diploscapter pachys]|uniref:Protein transport protein sec16 n=1 Tax=Diploscapter pachys TaxID=2018661 RepID=A0A2A2J1W6_9BILA|nr:hypothetical protein WR25_20357 isoform C [Diploscapter pachys]
MSISVLSRTSFDDKKIQLQPSSISSAAVSLSTSEQQNIPQQNWPTQYPQYYDPNQAYYNAVPMQNYHQIQQYYSAANQEQAIPQQIAYSNEPVQLPEHPGAQQQPRSETPSDDSWVKPEIEQDNQPKIADSSHEQRRNSKSKAEVKTEPSSSSFYEMPANSQNETETGGWEEEFKAPEQPPAIAQVAPIQVKHEKEPKRESAELTPVVARIEPVTQHQSQHVPQPAPHSDQNVQIQRVEPTPHSAQDTVDFGDILNAAPAQPLPVQAENVHPTAPPLPQPSSQIPAQVVQIEHSEQFEQPVFEEEQANAQENVDQPPATPKANTPVASPISPEQPQATSTPVTSNTSNTAVSSSSQMNAPENVSPIVTGPQQVQQHQKPRQRAGSHEKTSRKASTESSRSTASQREHAQKREKQGSSKNSEHRQQKGNESDSTTTDSLIVRNGSERRSVHDRYKNIMQERAHILSRISGYRNDNPQAQFRSVKTPVTNPLMQNISNEAVLYELAIFQFLLDTNNRNSVLGGKSSVPTNMSMDGSMMMDRMSVPVAYSTGIDPTLEHSVDLPKDQSGYGEDFVDAARRSRLNRNRPASRARSELGTSEGVYRMHGQMAPGPHAPFNPYMQQAFAHQFPGYYPQAHMMGRYSSIGDPYLDYRQPGAVDMRRPQSTYDPRAHERFLRAGGQMSTFDAFAPRDDEEELSDESGSMSDEDESESEERGESEEELRKYNIMQQQQQAQMRYNPRGPMSAYPLPVQGSLPPPGSALFVEPAVLYYLGSIHLDTNRANSILYHSPPPAEYHRLKPIEKAAYLFYAAVYKKLYSNVNDFHKKFNREFYKFICDGDTEDVALWKICKSMKDEHDSKRLTQSQKAYQASQSQLFSDERDSIDGMSDRASLYDKDEDRASDVASIDQRAPLKFRTPHAFVTFGAGGRLVTVHPDVSISTIQISDVKSKLKDAHTERLIDAIQVFKGPLLPGITPTHSVRLYIQRQMERIRHSEVATENPFDNDVIDTLLVWQLLEMVVQQQGRVTGPDLARLLVAAGESQAQQRNLPQAHHFHKEVPAPHHHQQKDASPAASTTQSELRLPVVDPRAFDRYTQFLLGGHVDEAVESAMRDGLYADAMIVARRLFAGDPRKIAQIEERFLQLRPAANPVTTLLAVASDQPAPVLSNPPVDDTGSWRTHAAIVLANLATPTAMNTVYHLGRVLAKREYHAAADFCFLAVALLAGIDPFRPVQNEEEDADVRKHIQLIHATLPDDEIDSTACRFGYCLDVARSLWSYYQQLSAAELYSLCDLADQIRFSAAAEPQDTAWIEMLRGMAATVQPQQQQQTVNEGGNLGNEQEHGGQEQNVNVENAQANQENRHINRSHSLSAEAEDWHAKHQEPLLMGQGQNQTEERRESVASSGTQNDRHQEQHHENQQQQQQRRPSESIAINRQSAVSPSDDDYKSLPNSPPDIQPQIYHHHNQQEQDNAQLMYYQQNYGDSTGNSTSETTESASEQTSGSSTVESSPERKLVPSNPLPSMPPQPYVPPSLAPATSKARTYPSATSAPLNTMQLPPQKPNLNPPKPGTEQPGALKNSSSGSEGFFSKIKKSIVNTIPGPNPMRLPEDTKKTIVWDPVKKRYVGEGVEEDAVTGPPPTALPSGNALNAAAAAQTNGPTPNSSVGGGLSAARISGGSRYFNPLQKQSASSGSSSVPTPASIEPPTMVPPTFGFFMPAPADNEGGDVDPFSAPMQEPQQMGGQHHQPQQENAQ